MRACNLTVTQKFTRRHSCSTKLKHTHAQNALQQTITQVRLLGFREAERESDCKVKRLYREKITSPCPCFGHLRFLVAVELEGKRREKKTERGERDLSQLDRCS